MPEGLSMAFFGSSLVSTYSNGAATYYRGIIRELHRRGHRVRFFEPDAFERQQHRDMADPDWCQVVVYPATGDGVEAALEQARGADLVIKASGVGVFDAWLERARPEWHAAARAGDAEQADPPPSAGPMTRVEALAVLGLEENAGADDIRAAHRRLIVLVHPDRGGTPYLAARLNQARDLLLGNGAG